MTLEMKLEDVRRASLQEGLEKGREEGVETTLVRVIKHLVKNEGWAFTKACDTFAVPTEMRDKIKKHLNS